MTPELIDLKRATAETIKGVGGLEAAAGFCRVGKSVLGDNQSVSKPDSFMALDVVAALEPLASERSGWPHVTRALCRANGGVFVRIPEARATGADMWALLARKAKEGADVSAALCEALADGRIDGREARRVRGEIAELMELLALMDAELTTIEEDS